MYGGGWIDFCISLFPNARPLTKDEQVRIREIRAKSKSSVTRKAARKAAKIGEKNDKE